MVIAAGRKEGCRIPEVLLHLETENTGIEADRAVEVRDFQVNVSDAGFGMNRGGHGGHRAFVAPA
jgi:hypothetical protein